MTPDPILIQSVRIRGCSGTYGDHGFFEGACHSVTCGTVTHCIRSGEKLGPEAPRANRSLRMLQTKRPGHPQLSVQKSVILDLDGTIIFLFAGAAGLRFPLD